MFNTTNL